MEGIGDLHIIPTVDIFEPCFNTFLAKKVFTR
jgi:hypothetical protein